jgi:hypothetical protein
MVFACALTALAGVMFLYDKNGDRAGDARIAKIQSSIRGMDAGLIAKFNYQQQDSIGLTPEGKILLLNNLKALCFDVTEIYKQTGATTPPQTCDSVLTH